MSAVILFSGPRCFIVRRNKNEKFWNSKLGNIPPSAFRHPDLKNDFTSSSPTIHLHTKAHCTVQRGRFAIGQMMRNEEDTIFNLPIASFSRAATQPNLKQLTFSVCEMKQNLLQLLARSERVLWRIPVQRHSWCFDFFWGHFRDLSRLIQKFYSLVEK